MSRSCVLLDSCGIMSHPPEQPAPSNPEEIPAPSAELVLIRVFAEAFLAMAHLKPRSRAREALKLASEILATEESVALTFPIRPNTFERETSRARRQAIAVFRQYLPTFAARLPRE